MIPADAPSADPWTGSATACWANAGTTASAQAAAMAVEMRAGREIMVRAEAVCPISSPGSK